MTPDHTLVQFIAAAFALLIAILAALLRLLDPLKKLFFRHRPMVDVTPELEKELEKVSLTMDDVRNFCRLQREDFRTDIKREIRLALSEYTAEWRGGVNEQLRQGEKDFNTLRKDSEELHNQIQGLSSELGAVKGTLETLNTLVRDLKRLYKTDNGFGLSK